MKLKKYNDFNQINEADQNDGDNILPKSVKDEVKKLLNDIKEDVIDDSMNPLLHPNFENESNNKLSYVINVVSEKDFTNIIREYIKDFVSDNIEIYKELDSRTTMLKFIDNEGDFIIPLITTMSGDNMMYDGDNKLTYNVWINTYVAKKL